MNHPVDMHQRKIDTLFYAIIMSTALFFFYQWENTEEKLVAISQQQNMTLPYHLREVVSVFASTEKTLRQYNYPLEDENRQYFQDAILKDHQRINHLSHSITLTRNPEITFLHDQYFWELQNVLKQLSGFRYSQEEMKIIINSFEHTKGSLSSVVYDDNFDIENKQSFDEFLEILKNFLEDMKEFKRF